MFLNKIRLINFRSFTELTLDSLTKINCLIGDNGTGKTNLLEGIYLLSSNKGFRTSDKKELSRYHSEGFFLQGNFEDEIIERAITEKKQKLTINEQPIPAYELRTHNPIVAFSPSDIFLTIGGSETRRRFFDAAIALRDNHYSEYLSTYERALRQRNSSLKKDPHHAHIWDETLITSGAKIIQKRLQFAKLLVPKVQTLYAELASGNATLKYFNNFKLGTDIEQSLADTLKQSYSEDLQRKHTSKGPHRDDITILIDDLPAAKSGSQGQNRTLAFALKIGSVEIIEETLKRKPILLIDDALLELDPFKRKKIFEKLNSLQLQLFLTGTTKEFFDFISHSEDISYIKFHSSEEN